MTVILLLEVVIFVLVYARITYNLLSIANWTLL